MDGLLELFRYQRIECFAAIVMQFQLQKNLTPRPPLLDRRGGERVTFLRPSPVKERGWGEVLLEGCEQLHKLRFYQL